MMGASENDPNASSNEMPQHRVYLDAFWIDQTETNNANFAKCVADGVCHPRLYTPYGDGITSATHLDYYANPIYGNYPVILYDGDEAQCFCEWAGKRLPSEAEWEKAARGTDGRTFPWGEGIDCGKASYFECEKDTTPVNARPSGASPYGSLNMAGSMWEWVADWYSPTYYANSETRNPHGPATGAARVVRGGGWRSNTQTLRTTSRMRGAMQHYFDSQIGFRCAMNDQDR